MDSNSNEENAKRHLYEDVASRIEQMIQSGTYSPGERIPSIRHMSRQMRVSINTVSSAYAHLEDLQLVEVRPQSGYYVRTNGPASLLEQPKEPDEDLIAKPVNVGEATLKLIRSLASTQLVPLASGSPCLSLLPVNKLNGYLAAETRKHPRESIAYSPTRGHKRLRQLIAQRLLTAGCSTAPDEITITSGCVEAVTLALQAVCEPGDAVAIASPVYYTFLNAIHWLGLKVVEIPSSPQQGINIDVLDYALRHHAIKAVVIISNFSNPSGSLMPDENKHRLVKLLAGHEIPLIEDDVYGELSFAQTRPTSVKSFDRNGLVIHCSSFSKTLAPGYRVGWIVAGRFQQKIEGLKSLFNIATASPTQLAIAEYLASGGYDRHLRSLRRTHATQIAQMRGAIGKYFPRMTRVSRPMGGFVLWVEMPDGVDAMALCHRALAQGIGISPGPLFTTGSDFANCIRLSASTWTPQIEEAVRTIGILADKLAGNVSVIRRGAA